MIVAAATWVWVVVGILVLPALELSGLGVRPRPGVYILQLAHRVNPGP
jgi:hypothetical protein